MIIKTPKIKFNQEIFLERAKKIHNDFYDYSKTIFIKKKEKIKIICPIHGEFEQIAQYHLNGNGCKLCANSKLRKKPFTTEEFINKAKLVHGDRYDYSKVNYIGALIKINIICKEHGEFWQQPSAHLKGNNCPNCSKNKKSNTEEFIIKALEIYKNKYDYSKVEYITSKNPIKIICNTCNTEFKQLPSNHLQGRGCPTCSKIKNLINWDTHISKGEKLILEWFIKNNILFSYQYLVELDETIRQTNRIYIDFFIKYNNKEYFVEYNGSQHYKYSPYFHRGGMIDFDIQLKRDKLLIKYCEETSKELIIFTYKNTEELIINKLSELFL